MAADRPRPPSAEQIVAARKDAGLTQTAAAELVYRSLGAWQKWEAGTREMDPALWELWRMKAASYNAEAQLPPEREARRVPKARQRFGRSTAAPC